MADTGLPCPSCGAPLGGRFCSACGAEAPQRSCVRCGSELTPGARFCHRCGTADRPGIPPRQERAAWTVALLLILVTVAAVAWEMTGGGGPVPTVPDMGNAGNASGAVTRAPDISTMSPRQRFDALFERVVRAADRQMADTVLFFAPMAIGAYAQLDRVDADARYHAAMIHLVVGELAEARALADTILAESPGHLFGLLIRGEVAESQGDTAARNRADAGFLAAYDAEMAADRPGYEDHRGALEDYRNRALARRK